ncbi:orotate phosphoribosyltransferase [Extremus antarcticus]|uniref:Orotate phosphoribosyltransferase n=1 Tax=Extremus antarcticus TaxID=702011 RepID=A0AAJ0DJ68_9PEZI|nr:orotate phosphoribosyltransferase [Extremus antarcticus]
MPLPEHQPNKHLDRSRRGHVHGLKSLGHSIHAIERLTGIPRTTVRNVLKGGVKPSRKENPPGATKGTRGPYKKKTRATGPQTRTRAIAIMPPSEPLPQWKQDLISLTLKSSILTFGTFTLKSGRVSPYFFNCGLFCTGSTVGPIASAYARTLHEYSLAHPNWGFDVLFGPAYKGIPICATTLLSLSQLEGGVERYGGVGYTFNRKEAKDHGEGGVLVGDSVRGKRVVVIDDVMTSGKAIREAVEIIKAQGGTLVGIVVAVDREEKMPSPAERPGERADGTVERGSAIGEVRRETGVPVVAVLTLRDIMKGMEGLGRHEEVEAMRRYWEEYGARD